MDRIYNSLVRAPDGTARELPLVIPRPVPGLISRRVLVQDFLHGVYVVCVCENVLGSPLGSHYCAFISNTCPFYLSMVFATQSPLSRARDEMLKKGIDPDSPESKLFGRQLLKSLTTVFGRTILETGFFHAGKFVEQPYKNASQSRMTRHSFLLH